MRTKEEITNELLYDEANVEVLKLEVLIDIRDQLAAITYYLQSKIIRSSKQPAKFKF